MVYLSKASACDRWIAVADSIRLVREYACMVRCYRFIWGALRVELEHRESSPRACKLVPELLSPRDPHPKADGQGATSPATDLRG